jgi:hypothetical protein
MRENLHPLINVPAQTIPPQPIIYDPESNKCIIGNPRGIVKGDNKTAQEEHQNEAIQPRRKYGFHCSSSMTGCIWQLPWHSWGI